MMKTFFSKGVAFLLAASLLVASLTSCKNDDDDDDEEVSSNSSAPSASVLAGKMFTTVKSASTYSEVAKNDDIIVVFNSSGSVGEWYELEDEDSAVWESVSFSYNSSTGEVSVKGTTIFSVVTLSSGYGFYEIDEPLGSDLSAVLTYLIGHTVVASDGKVTYNGSVTKGMLEEEMIYD